MLRFRGFNVTAEAVSAVSMRPHELLPQSHETAEAVLKFLYYGSRSGFNKTADVWNGKICKN
jgi:hypothetical protein